MRMVFSCDHMNNTVATKRLSDAELNRPYVIETLDGPDVDCRRLLDLGFTPGEEVTIRTRTPLGDPLVVYLRGVLLAVRRREASWILVH